MRTGIPFRDWYFTALGMRWGFQSNTLFPQGKRYMDRWIIYLGWICLRLHRIWEGDDSRAPHDHPWWFITFPFTDYMEKLPHRWSTSGCGCWVYRWNFVSRFRFHFRGEKYRHIITGRTDGKGKPFWTFVIAGERTNKWGFWKSPTDFTYWRNWK